MNSFHRSLLVTTALSAALVSGVSLAADAIVTTEANVYIAGNNDSSSGSEGVYITSNSGSGPVAPFQATLGLFSNGQATLGANNILTLNGGVTNINSGSTMSLATTTNTSITSGGNTTITTTGTNTITGATNNIGSTGNTTIASVGTNTITGAANNILGATSINASNNAVTNINTGTSTSAVTIGNSLNTTNINSATTNIGTGAFSSLVTIGSTQAGTRINTTAGNATTTVANNTINSSVQGTGSINGALSVVNTGQTGAVVDANGKITSGTTTQTTAALTVTNALGNTHGLVVQQNQTVISGGNNSTSFTLNDNGATFANSATGAPVKVTGVADGVNSYDAVNVRQLHGVYAGVAGTAAMANIPAIQSGKTYALGIGVGGFKGQGAVAVGAAIRLSDHAQLRASLSSGLNNDTGSRNTAVAVGAGFSF